MFFTSLPLVDTAVSLVAGFLKVPSYGLYEPDPCPNLEIPLFHNRMDHGPKEVYFMRVYLRSYRIPTVLIIMGSIMCIAATLSVSVQYTDILFYEGLFCVSLGILGWVIPSFVRFLKVGSKTKKTTTTSKQTTMTQRRI